MVARMALAEELDIVGEVRPANQNKRESAYNRDSFVSTEIRERRYDQRRRV